MAPHGQVTHAEMIARHLSSVSHEISNWCALTCTQEGAIHPSAIPNRSFGTVGDDASQVGSREH